ncbi:hypothetical protein GUJ93_ZPchr0010g7536 [Zizania palustris]|uniref:Uncharacterized protein n=1 Tax=Zizania palustris TaxID=103762 RepID=A0A8J5W9Q6_ZIZPA|nr:hypothetical protein GUJ93_ZPchr0010g7536 [Zizania palustris]
MQTIVLRVACPVTVGVGAVKRVLGKMEGLLLKGFQRERHHARKTTLQHFLNAATDEQVTEGRLITEGQETAGQIVPAQGGNTTMEDEAS